jgi:hypothetical protein
MLRLRIRVRPNPTRRGPRGPAAGVGTRRRRPCRRSGRRPKAAVETAVRHGMRVAAASASAPMDRAIERRRARGEEREALGGARIGRQGGGEAVGRGRVPRLTAPRGRRRVAVPRARVGRGRNGRVATIGRRRTDHDATTGPRETGHSANALHVTPDPGRTGRDKAIARSAIVDLATLDRGRIGRGAMTASRGTDPFVRTGPGPIVRRGATARGRTGHGVTIARARIGLEATARGPIGRRRIVPAATTARGRIGDRGTTDPVTTGRRGARSRRQKGSGRTSVPGRATPADHRGTRGRGLAAMGLRAIARGSHGRTASASRRPPRRRTSWQMTRSSLRDGARLRRPSSPVGRQSDCSSFRSAGRRSNGSFSTRRASGSRSWRSRAGR